METLEGYDRKITEHLEMLRECTNYCNIRQEDAEMLSDDYFLISIRPIIDKNFDEFYDSVERCGIINRLTEITMELRQHFDNQAGSVFDCDIGENSSIQIAKLLKSMESITYTTKTIRNEIKNCCGEPMVYESDERQLECETCGHSISMDAIVFDKAGTYAQETGSMQTINETHEPRKHYNSWQSRILGTCLPGYDSNVVETIKNHIARQRQDVRRMKYADMRKILKQLKLTAHNNYVTHLLRDVCGISPPILPFRELELHEQICVKVMLIFEELFPDRNHPYYPFFMQQVWAIMYRNDPVKIKVCDYIHMQQPKTYRRKLDEWNRICNRDPSIIQMCNVSKLAYC